MNPLLILPPGSNFFPHPAFAADDGLLCIGGDLNPKQLLLAYRFGIFPWYSEGQPLLWWSPNPRLVLYPDQLKIAKSMRNCLNRGQFTVTLDRKFEHVIDACKVNNRKSQNGSWITDEMERAYIALHHLGFAHSLEVWQDDDLVGGLYGIALGKVFYGESMFYLANNASKFGFIKLVKLLIKKNYHLIDCQQDTAHLRSMGAVTISRDDFLAMMRKNLLVQSDQGSWSEFEYLVV